MEEAKTNAKEEQEKHIVGHKKAVEEEQERHAKRLQLIEDEFKGFHKKVKEDLEKLEEKIKMQLETHKRAMLEIGDTLVSKVQPPATTAAAAAHATPAEVDEVAIRTHLMQDQNVMAKALSEEQAIAMTASFKVFMVQQKQEWMRQQALHENADSSDDDLELMEHKEGDDGFAFQTRGEKKSRRRARRAAATQMIDDTDVRRPAQKREGSLSGGEEQPAKKSQDISTEAAADGLQPSLASGSKT